MGKQKNLKDLINSNQGVVDLLGHLAAIGQRGKLIKQGAETHSLFQQHLSIEQQRLEAEAEQKRRQNLLFEINETIKVIAGHYLVEPVQAYYQSILLNRQVTSLELSHEWFDTLEWKNYSTTTLANVKGLLSQAIECLTTEMRESIEVEMRQEESARIEELESAKRQTIVQQERQQANLARVQIVCGCLVLLFSLLMLKEAPWDTGASAESKGESWIPITFFVLCAFFGFRLLKRGLRNRDNWRTMFR